MKERGREGTGGEGREGGGGREGGTYEGEREGTMKERGKGRRQ